MYLIYIYYIVYFHDLMFIFQSLPFGFTVWRLENSDLLFYCLYLVTELIILMSGA